MGKIKQFFGLEERASFNTMDVSTPALADQNSFTLDSLLNPDAITEEKVMSIPTAKACIDLISGTVAQIPLYLYKQNKDGSVERVDGDYRENLINSEPTDFLNGYNLKKFMVKDYLLHGASYVAMIQAGNRVLELHPLPSRSVVVLKTIQNGYRTLGANIYLANSENGAINEVTKTNMVFKPHDLVIALQDSHDGLTSVGIIQKGQDIFNQALSEILYTKNLYATGALPLGLLKTEGRLNDNQATSLRNAWAALYGGVQNSAKTVVLQEGLSYEALSMNPSQIQMTETRKGTNSEICKLFNIPEPIVNAALTSQYVSIEQNSLNFLKNTLAPVIVAIEQAFDRAVLLESEKEKGYFFRFDTAELVRATDAERVNTVVAGVTGGVYTINEARAKLDLPNISGDILKMSLGDVMLDPETGEHKVPNVEGGSNPNEDGTKTG